jgi:hypothetical protein
VTARTRREVADFEWRMERDHAETVPCPHCAAPPHRTCVNRLTGDELHAPAHPQRITTATRQENPRG